MVQMALLSNWQTAQKCHLSRRLLPRRQQICLVGVSAFQSVSSP
uniref:Uncharacterized protein n=1 Tax=Arundo donax TaxID=35708 RepID=A0A0A9DFT5_ARUDO